MKRGSKSLSPGDLHRSRRDHAILAITFLAGLVFCVETALAQRHALVIGNGTYDYARRLPNAPNDARDVAAALKKAGWEVTERKDAGIKEMTRALRVFCEDAAGSDAALFFYAGHGMEVKGMNYLLPVDAELTEADGEDALPLETLALDQVLRSMAAARIRLKTVVLDCCRDNPLDRSWLASIRSGNGGGLAEVRESQLPEGAMLVFSTAPGKTASDGTDRNSPFTAALLSRMNAGGGSVADIFGDVASTLGSRQAAWIRFDGSGMSFTAFRKYPLVPGDLPSSGNMPPLPPPQPTPAWVSAADRLRAATIDRPFVNSLGLEFIPVPGKPGVFMCRTETRVRDFRAYVGATNYRQTGGCYVLKATEREDGSYSTNWVLDDSASWEAPGFFQTEDHPVVSVSWVEAHAFCEWLSSKESGLAYRLPTDSEWSAAAGTLNKFPWGNEWPPPQGAGNYAGAEKISTLPGNGWSTAYDHSDGHWNTARVASFQMNRFGFYDLGGNVWEWCEDSYLSSMNNTESIEAYPVLKGEISGNGTPFRVVRGGGWDAYTDIHLQTSLRLNVHPTRCDVSSGFRVVVEAATSVGG